VRVAAFVPDLMDRSRLGGRDGIEFVSDVAALAGTDAEIVVVDLSRPGVLDAVPSIGAPTIIGFGSHVERDLLDAATAAGCTLVLPRSAFFRRLDELL
jgi:hypothetical protein